MFRDFDLTIPFIFFTLLGAVLTKLTEIVLWPLLKIGILHLADWIR